MVQEHWFLSLSRFSRTSNISSSRSLIRCLRLVRFCLIIKELVGVRVAGVGSVEVAGGSEHRRIGPGLGFDDVEEVACMDI
jgi:hypothetical protein